MFGEWEAHKVSYRSGAEFARAVCSALPEIKSTKTVERWVTEWRRRQAKGRQASS